MIRFPKHRPAELKVPPAAWDVLVLLGVHPRCPLELTRHEHYRYGARIDELRRAGAVIGSRPCSMHSHGRRRQVEYFLEHVPQAWLAYADYQEKIVQPSLLGDNA